MLKISLYSTKNVDALGISSLFRRVVDVQLLLLTVVLIGLEFLLCGCVFLRFF